MKASPWFLLVSSCLLLTHCGDSPPPDGVDETATGSDEAADVTTPAPLARTETPSGSPTEQSPLPSLVGLSRDFRSLSEAETEQFHAKTTEFWSSTGLQARLAILDQLESELYGAEILTLAAGILAPGRVEESELRMRAVELLAGNRSAEILPVLRDGLNDMDEGVQEGVLEAVRAVTDPAVVDFLGEALERDNPQLRLTGLDVMDGLEPELRGTALGRAFESPHEDVAVAAVTLAEVEASPETIGLLFDALETSNETVREEARISLQQIFELTFTDAPQARAWWLAHRQDYDSNLEPRK